MDNSHTNELMTRKRKEQRRELKQQQRPMNQLQIQEDNADLSSEEEQDFQ